uniref:Calmodulin n=1 Tax=Alexandrium monilatum TaxID=311494 RepID=A0A7S4Q0P6_9DINO
MRSGGRAGARASREERGSIVRPPTIDAENVFVYYDRDGDGRLSQDEFLAALRAMGACPSTADMEEARKTWGSTPNAKAFKEAAAVLRSKRPQPEDLAAQFRGLAQGGLVDADVLKYTATRYGDCLSPEEADELMRLADPDEEGHVNVKRLAEALLQPLGPARQ